jgi:pimeloyl-ACP methyl ester carboxylesterase
MTTWHCSTLHRIAVVAFCSLLVAFCSQDASSQEEHVYDFQEIDGNRIAWSCEGSGEPTIALIAGAGLSAHESFGRIYHSYRGSGRICMYDRAGIGKSTFARPENRRLAQLATELRELSVRERWGRLILVAHSFGGFLARAYAAQYPDEVLGILFLDAVHEDWLPRLKSEMVASDWAIMESTVSWNLSTFHEDYYEAQEAVRTLALRDALPITVVSRGLPHTTARVAGMSYDGVDVFNAEHDALQAKLLALSSDTEHRVARYSSHIVNDTDPWLVIEEISKLVNRTSERKVSN